jgi:CRISPR system Cascade subunit CasA
VNLLNDPWLPFRFRDGSEKSCVITEIINPEVVDFALPRADFQGAAYQFSIGLLQTVLAPADGEEWAEYYNSPPSLEVLSKALAQVEHAFNVSGDGPLFMQDFDPLDEQASTTVAGLLIEAPGANGIKLNTDHFIKRGIGNAMSVEMAVLALFTLQINAPAGGAGHRVGLRGGGPLTTLLMPTHDVPNLWQKLWLNIINKDVWRELGDQADFSDGSIFPWLAPTKLSDKKGSEIYAKDVHPLHMYWAMPRRIRLDIEHQSVICAISGEVTDYSVTSYRTQNYGGNYSGTWYHPLTPYKWDPKKPDDDSLSAKGQPGGITYKNWDALAFSSGEEGQKAAAVVEHYYTLKKRYKPADAGQIPHLMVFGYDMDNMKARGWYSKSMPLFNIDIRDQDRILNHVHGVQKLASNMLWHCRTQVKAAWFEKPSDVKGDTSFIDLTYWQKTESVFFQLVTQISENITNETESSFLTDSASSWLKQMQTITLSLFDEHALSELGNNRSMAKRIEARRALTGWLYGGKDIKSFKTKYGIPEKKTDKESV